MAKDWSGNTNSIFKTHGASNHTEFDREEHDFYATPPVATKALIHYCANNNIDLGNKTILEPCCGKGHISEVLKTFGLNVESMDLINRGYGDSFGDFLTNTDKNVDKHIITNPPYKFAKEFVEHSMQMLNNDCYVCMLLKLTFLEGIKRQPLFNKYPPYKVLVFSDRINCSLGGDFEKDSELGGAVCYAWFVWKNGYKGQTTIDWINAR